MTDDSELVTICSICAHCGVDCFTNPDCLRAIQACPDFLAVAS